MGIKIMGIVRSYCAFSQAIQIPPHRLQHYHTKTLPCPASEQIVVSYYYTTVVFVNFS